MKLKSPKEWEGYIKSRGLEPELEKTLSAYASNLSSKNLPVIFELEHLSNILDIEHDEMRVMVNGSDWFYREFEIPKRRGGVRVIKVPYSSLMHAQYWLKEAILDKEFIHSKAHGFANGKSIKSHVECHCHSLHILKLDIKDFFPTFKKSWVANYFNQLGYAPNVAFYLANLTTDTVSLVQGAPTSPVLSNILFRKADRALNKIAVKYELSYSRYADDMCFSGNYIPKKLLRLVERILRYFGFQLNSRKTYLGPVNGCHITGIKVVDGQLKVSRKLKRELRKQIHFIGKYGLLSHVNKKRIRDVFFVERLMGQLNFWKFIEPEHEFPIEALSLLRQKL
ncbi:RNA-directed DNA polymerase [Aliidiomarina iranensis]|uniref:RNA-directed DNA polymerase n=1 Tax=Aliidiomarina iranensis TaxID=1434071 RepID=A0A432VWT4_9GAMM|nr:reverse transcriptase family protein [Aliidiomarina iranensis]RUO20921.1 RNA-directed DNA polymerase [Aliidiomarina iranensis]